MGPPRHRPALSTGLATEVWDAYWVPVRNAAGKAVPGTKTNLVYTADAVRGVEVFEVTLPTAKQPVLRGAAWTGPGGASPCAKAARVAVWETPRP